MGNIPFMTNINYPEIIPDHYIHHILRRPSSAGHDYGKIETNGFPKLVVDGGNGAEIIDNPRWIGNRKNNHGS